MNAAGDETLNISTKNEDAASALKNGDNHKYVYSAVRTPPPPGFSLADGLMLMGENRKGAESAPPIGFGLRTTPANENDAFDFMKSLGEDSTLVSGPSSHMERMRMMQRPIAQNRDLLQPSDLINGVGRGATRSTSFTNLAAVLGEGLAESMGDSLQDERKNIVFAEGALRRHSQGRNVDVDNFARQSRQTVSRLVGASNSMLDPTGKRVVPARMISSSGRINSEQSSLFPSSGGEGLSSLGERNVNRFHDSVTAVEPSTSPAPHRLNLSQSNGKNFSSSLSKRANPQFEYSISGAGRASAPPQVFDSTTRDHGGTSAALRYQTASSLKQRAASLQAMKAMRDKNSPTIPTPGTTPSPSYSNNSPAKFQPPSRHPSPHFVQNDDSKLRVEEELDPFVWDASAHSPSSPAPSRAISILGTSGLGMAEVRSTCEAFGSLQYFRSEFCSSRGFILLAYHDLRSARHAAKELKSYLLRLSGEPNQGQKQFSNFVSANLKVLYCVPLTSCSEKDDSTIIISNIPHEINDNDVNELATSYGAVRSVQFHAEGGIFYTIEFYDTQDASQALFEIQSARPWGEDVVVEFNSRPAHERRLGKELQTLIARWRHGGGKKNSTKVPEPTIAQPSVSSGISSPNPSQPSTDGSNSLQSYVSDPSVLTSAPGAYPATQLVVGPDGRYQYVMVPPQNFASNGQFSQHEAQVAQQHHLPTNHGNYIPPQTFNQNYWVGHSQQLPSVNPSNVASYHQIPGHGVSQFVDVHNGHVIPMYNVPHSTIDSSLSSGGRTSSNGHSTLSGGERGQRIPQAFSKPGGGKSEESIRLALDIEAVKRGSDSRTSLMVRNIPNKYTQSMLLAEFEEGGHGPGKIDFFYLPIDFRNKCNRGYAFVNFVDFRDVVTFHETYNGKPWKIFKSDKICEITYARIQGKAGMMKRFQNSVLMEKDPEYRPLIFSSEGENWN